MADSSQSLSQEQLDEARNKLAAGRIIATELQPYLSTSLYAMIPVPIVGFGTFAVDKRWRMYYDPAKCLEWTVQEIAAVWLHEVGHLQRDHTKRFESIDYRHLATEWNYAADATINSDLKDQKILLPNPRDRFYADSTDIYPEWKKGMGTEELFGIAIRGKESSNEDSSDSSDSSQEQNEDNDDNNDSQEDQQNSSTDDSSSNDGEDTNESESDESEDNNSDSNSENDSDENNESDDASSSESNSENNGSSSDSDSSSEDDSSQDKSSSSSSSDSQNNEQDNADKSDNDDADSEHSTQPPAEESSHQPSDCGSGATGGLPRDYELGDLDDGSLNDAESEMVRRETAKAIVEASEQRGDVPGGLLRDAKETLSPQTNWRRELPSMIRRQVAAALGKNDYSYSRPSRRGAASAFYLPSLKAPDPPSMAIIVDTSGSVNDQQLGRVLAEIVAIIKRNTAGSKRGRVHVITCDAKAHVQEIKKASDIDLIGGGGTDMRVGFRAAEELREVPDIILCITDGYTPYPTKPSLKAERKNTLYIVGLVPPVGHETAAKNASSGVPAFMKVIHIKNI